MGECTRRHWTNPEGHGCQHHPGFQAQVDEGLLRHARGLYGVEQAAEWLSVSPAMVGKLLRSGALRGVKVGARTCVAAAELDRYVAELRLTAFPPKGGQ